MYKQDMRDLIVLLPGITGSVLQDAEGKEVWAPPSSLLWNYLSRDSFQKLKLAAHLPGTVPPDDGIHATALVPGFHGVFGLVKID